MSSTKPALTKQVGFQRFQINATATNGVDISVFSDDEGAARCVSALRRAFAELPQVEFIIQRNSQTRPLWERLQVDPPANMSLLFDDSMGLGKSSTSWPSPPALEQKFGYAGKPIRRDTAPHRVSSTVALQFTQLLHHVCPPASPTRLICTGGLGNENISSQLQLIQETAPGRELWVDMESSLRTTLQDETDIFDCNKAMACVRHVIDFGLKPDPARNN